LLETDLACSVFRPRALVCPRRRSPAFEDEYEHEDEDDWNNFELATQS